MKRMLFGGVIAVVLVAVVTDEVRLHRVIQHKNGALERLTVEVSDLQRAAADREKKLSATHSLVLAPNAANSKKSGSATIFNVVPGKGGMRSAAPFATPSFQVQPSKVPPNWEPFEFNGQTYYRIPLANASPEPLGFRP